MEESEADALRREQNRRLVELCRRVSEEKSDKARAREWAGVSSERKGEILAALLDVTAAMAADVGGGWPKPRPLVVRERLERAQKRLR